MKSPKTILFSAASLPVNCPETRIFALSLYISK
nr:MAG TPA: hypothetical protein [Caudoviricetes sp.]